MKEITERIAELKKEHGEHEGYVLLEDACHGCRPGYDHVWVARAVKINGGKALMADITWDFEEFVEENGDTEDASDYPWEDEEIMDIESDIELDLTDDYDLSQLLHFI